MDLTTENNPSKEVEVIFRHPNREMLRNQLGMFIIEVLIEQPATGMEAFVERKIDQLMRVLDGKAGF